MILTFFTLNQSHLLNHITVRTKKLFELWLFHFHAINENLFNNNFSTKKKFGESTKNEIQNILLLTLIKLQDVALCTQIKQFKSQIETKV